VVALNECMGRCVYCHSVVVREEDYCYVCGDSVPPEVKSKAAVKPRPVSGWTNLVFLASLGFMAYCFFGAHKLSLPLTIAASASLLLLRIIAEQLANKNSN
jgi:hypothetical protein